MLKTQAFSTSARVTAYDVKLFHCCISLHGALCEVLLADCVVIGAFLHVGPLYHALLLGGYFTDTNLPR